MFKWIVRISGEKHKKSNIIIIILLFVFCVLSTVLSENAIPISVYKSYIFGSTSCYISSTFCQQLSHCIWAQLLPNKTKVEAIGRRVSSNNEINIRVEAINRNSAQLLCAVPITNAKEPTPIETLLK